MRPIPKVKNILRGALQRWGPQSLKQRLWDAEFASGRWNFIQHTEGDLVYSFISRYCVAGDILDLGCGYGNTAFELPSSCYANYTGVDISTVALKSCAEKAIANRLSAKTEFLCSDILTFIPARHYDLILFRESIYYIPERKIVPTLRRYAQFLTEEGVFLVRWHKSSEAYRLKNVIGSAFHIVENRFEDPGPAILVLSTRSRSGNGRTLESLA
jgi:SAM-dependent methyltransferase